MTGPLTVDECHARAFRLSFANDGQVLAKELVAFDLKALLDYLRRVLIDTVVHRTMKDMIDSTTHIIWCAMLADVLNTPIAELAMSNEINVAQHLFNALTLNDKLVGAKVMA